MNTMTYKLHLACLFLIPIFMFSCDQRRMRLQATSMEPTLKMDEVITVTKSKKYKVGDIVAFKKEGEIWLFRIVAKPGDSLLIKDRDVFVNGQKVNYPSGDPTIPHSTIGHFDADLPGATKSNGWNADNYGPIKLPKKRQRITAENLFLFPNHRYLSEGSILNTDAYFLMGDNRGNALDSRFIGLISEEDFVGVVTKE